MSFDNTKHDIELNGVGYRVKGYQRQEQSIFIPRFGVGDQRETEFDLLRSKTVDGFEGGMLQRFFEDNKSVFGAEHLFPVYDDGVLYPVNSLTRASGLLGSSKAALFAYCANKDYLFFAYQTFNMPTTSIKRIDSSGNIVTLTIPTAL
ncbi:MAG TPA: hypothetical protein VEC37_01775, partial [Bacillota bacterium]|nr:hypothetical protein [Bacillota bacterium]